MSKTLAKIGMVVAAAGMLATGVGAIAGVATIAGMSVSSLPTARKNMLLRKRA